MRDWTDRMNELRARLDEQNTELEQVWATLGSFGDGLELSIPQAVLEELDDLSSPALPQVQTPICGGIRA